MSGRNQPTLGAKLSDKGEGVEVSEGIDSAPLSQSPGNLAHLCNDDE